MRPRHVKLGSEVLQSGLRQGLRVCFELPALLPRPLQHLVHENPSRSHPWNKSIADWQPSGSLSQVASSPEPIEAFCLDSRCQRQTLWAGFWAMHGSFSGNASAAQGLVLLVEVLLDLTHRFLGNLVTWASRGARQALAPFVPLGDRLRMQGARKSMLRAHGALRSKALRIEPGV